MATAKSKKKTTKKAPAKTKAAASRAKKTSTKAKATTKSAAKKTTKKVASTPAAVPKPAASGSSSVNAGTIIFALLLLAIGLVGWYILSESDKINDEYDKADQGNNTILKKQEAPAPVEEAVPVEEN